MGPGRRIRSSRLVVVLVATLLVTASCGGSDGGGDDASSPGSGGGGGDAPDAAEVADRSAEFRYAISYGYNTFDPHRRLTDDVWLRHLYDGLLAVVPTAGGLEIGPQLATSWEIADDGLSVAFKLRDDVTFQDGTAFDASAVKANVERAKGPGTTVSSDVENVASVEVVDATHVVMHLTRPDPSILWTMASSPAGMMISPAAFDSDLATHPAGSGPFTLVSAQKDADVVFQRWDDHWDPDAALVEKLTISTIPDGNARFNGVRSGEYDAANMSSPHDVESKALASEGFHWVQALSPIEYGLMLNNRMAPLDDVRVRRAIYMAVNRPEISRELLDGLNPPAYQPFADGYLGHAPDLDDGGFDLDEARQLVTAAGAEGATIQIIQQQSAPQQSLALVLQQSLGEIGLDVELVPLSATEARPAWKRGGHHGFVGPMNARPEPSATLRLSYLSQDNPGEPPPELVEMAEAAMVLPVGSAEREEAVHVPIAQFSAVHLAREDVVGADNLPELAFFDLRGVGIAAS